MEAASEIQVEAGREYGRGKDAIALPNIGQSYSVDTKKELAEIAGKGEGKSRNKDGPFPNIGEKC